MSQKISTDSKGMTVTKESSFISPLNSPSVLTKSNYVLHLHIFIVTVHCHVTWDFFIFTAFKELETQNLSRLNQLSNARSSSRSFLEEISPHPQILKVPPLPLTGEPKSPRVKWTFPVSVTSSLTAALQLSCWLLSYTSTASKERKGSPHSVRHYTNKTSQIIEKAGHSYFLLALEECY